MKSLLNNLLKPQKKTVRKQSTSRLGFESLETRQMMAADFAYFDIFDASGDVTPDTVFQDGALRINYDINLDKGEILKDLHLLVEYDNQISKFSVAPSLSTGNGLPTSAVNLLINLNNHTELVDGRYEASLVAETSYGQTSVSNKIYLQVLDTIQLDGSFQGELLNLNEQLANKNTGIVVHGFGGTDTLDLSKFMPEITAINGMKPENFDPLKTAGLPIHQGYAVDHIVLQNGNEIYFTGIERLAGSFSEKYASSSSVDLMVKPNDAEFNTQWNLHVSDVPSAWRFTTGSDEVLLVSLDTGVLPEDTPESIYGKIADLTESRLITDATDVEDRHILDQRFGHGHMAISVMSSTPNNSEFVAGINWKSDVYVADVYDASVDLQSAIEKALDYAADKGMKVVFQGGIQGESWLNSGGTQAELEALFAANKHRALFAVAAGNAGVNIDATSDVDTLRSGGVSRLQWNHDNVMSIGALQHDATTVAGMANAADVYKASYSNFGENLTLMGATDSPATYQFTGVEAPQFSQDNGVQTFGGTSAANPNVAGIASLVWSMNTGLTGSDIRKILTETAMDNLPNGGGVHAITGNDSYYGHGLVNADLAVRRAMALAKDEALVKIDADPRLEFPKPVYEKVAEKDSQDPYFTSRSLLSSVTTMNSNTSWATPPSTTEEPSKSDQLVSTVQKKKDQTPSDFVFSQQSQQSPRKSTFARSVDRTPISLQGIDSAFQSLGSKLSAEMLRFSLGYLA